MREITKHYYCGAMNMSREGHKLLRCTMFSPDVWSVCRCVWVPLPGTIYSSENGNHYLDVFFFLFFKKTEWKEGLSSLYTFQHNCRLQSNLQDVMSQRVVEGDFPPQSQQQKVLSHRRLATSTGLTGELQSVQRTYTVQTILYT